MSVTPGVKVWMLAGTIRLLEQGMLLCSVPQTADGRHHTAWQAADSGIGLQDKGDICDI